MNPCDDSRWVGLAKNGNALVSNKLNNFHFPPQCQRSSVNNNNNVYMFISCKNYYMEIALNVKKL